MVASINTNVKNVIPLAVPEALTPHGISLALPPFFLDAA